MTAEPDAPVGPASDAEPDCTPDEPADVLTDIEPNPPLDESADVAPEDESDVLPDGPADVAPADAASDDQGAARPDRRPRLRWATVAPVVAVALVLVGVVIGVRAEVSAPPVSSAAVTAPVAAPAAAAPEGAPAGRGVLRATTVFLPTLGVRSALVDLDIGPDGELQAPSDPDVAGWFVHGAVPGDPGPAVIAGHVDSRTGPAVFYRLDQLAVGDRVEVGRSDGQVFGYRVVTVETVPKDAFPTARVYGPTPGPELRLITCGGVFDRHSSHYRDNVIVTAIPA